MRNRIEPTDNLLLGARAIMKYLGVKSLNALHNWIDNYGLPVVKRPDEQLMTTVTAIDQWIFLSAELRAEKRQDSAQRRVAMKAMYNIDLDTRSRIILAHIEARKAAE
jgi:hypothetical protein